jgi:hypothetical protein
VFPSEQVADCVPGLACHDQKRNYASDDDFADPAIYAAPALNPANYSKQPRQPANVVSVERLDKPSSFFVTHWPRLTMLAMPLKNIPDTTIQASSAVPPLSAGVEHSHSRVGQSTLSIATALQNQRATA